MVDAVPRIMFFTRVKIRSIIDGQFASLVWKIVVMSEAQMFLIYTFEITLYTKVNYTIA